MSVLWSPSKSTDGFAAQLNAGGAAEGVTEFEAAESAPGPTTFTARTLNVYAVPFVRLLISVAVTFPTAVDVWAVTPMYGVTVYPLIALPPSDTGAVHDTVAEAFPATAATPVGTPGTVGGGAPPDPAAQSERCVTFQRLTLEAVNPFAAQSQV